MQLHWLNSARNRFAVTAIAASLLCASTLVTSPAGASIGTPSTATGTFSRNLVGVSNFTQTNTTITVNGRYSGLIPGHSYYTVIYGNTNCDPAAAFPTGYFTANALGEASWRTTVQGPAGIVAGTGSVSVRRADNSKDIDHDGRIGRSDVVAVAGQPKIGLIECDTAPVVVPGV